MKKELLSGLVLLLCLFATGASKADCDEDDLTDFNCIPYPQLEWRCHG